MLIASDSAFRKLPSALSKKQLRIFGAIRYSIEMYESAFKSMIGILYELSPETMEKAKSNIFLPLVLVYAWSMVDSANRLRLLLEHMPNVRRGFKFKANFQKLADFENLRNPIQHLNTEIHKNSQNTEVDPTWGSLSWNKIIETNPLKINSYVLLPGSLEKYKGIPLNNPVGKNFTSVVDHVVLSAYGTIISLSEAYFSIANISKLLENSLEKAFNQDNKLNERLAADLLLVTEFTFDADTNKSRIK